MNENLTIVEVTGSANTDLLRAGKEGAPHGCGLAARRQTSGRGRRGHTWDSGEGNLLLSIVLRPNVPTSQLNGLAAVSGLAALGELERMGFANEIKLKWPNDLTARDSKLGGILIETARDNEGQTFAVCGIGINIAHAPSKVPDAGLSAISLADLNETVPSAEELTHIMYRSILGAVDAWAQAINTLPNGTGPLEPIHEAYCKRLCWIGNDVIARSSNGSELARGRFDGIDTYGRALIINGTTVSTLHFEEASIRPLSPEAH